MVLGFITRIGVQIPAYLKDFQEEAAFLTALIFEVFIVLSLLLFLKIILNLFIKIFIL